MKILTYLIDNAAEVTLPSVAEAKLVDLLKSGINLFQAQQYLTQVHSAAGAEAAP